MEGGEPEKEEDKEPEKVDDKEPEKEDDKEPEKEDDDITQSQKKQQEHYKKVLKLQEENQDAADKRVARRYGSKAATLKGRKQLSRNKALAYVLLSLYRLAMQAVIMLALYEWPVLQIIFSLLLNFIWIIILIVL